MIQRFINKVFTEISHVRRTTAFRVSLLATLVASILTCISMLMIYQTARQEISIQVDSRLFAEAIRIRQLYDNRVNLNLLPPVVGVTERVPGETGMVYCVRDSILNDSDGNLIGEIRALDIRLRDLCTVDIDEEELFAADTPPMSLIVNDSDDFMRIVALRLNNRHTLVLGYDTQKERRILRGMFSMVVFATSLLIIASFIGSFFISHTIAKSVRRISRIARSFADGNFGRRIQIKNSDSNEMQSLASDLNHMLERIDGLISSQRQVTNNIAHDMRSPLNRLRSRMEVALLDRKSSCDDLRDCIADSVEDIGKLLQTFNAMLSIAQVEARARDDFKLCSLSEICMELGEMYEIFAEESGEHQFTNLIVAQASALGNRQLIAQAVTNLLDNAIKYTPKGGKISLIVQKKKHYSSIIVTDNGNGIPEEDRKRVLERFVRLDSSRTLPGNGLGLSMVVAVMNLHGGKVILGDNQPGLKIELRFPNPDDFQKNLKGA